MGGIGSGRRSQSGKDVTDEYRSLDVRRLQRDGLLTPVRFFTWNWLRDGETVASIQVEVQSNRVILKYRHQSRGSEWQPMEYPVWLDFTPCTLGGRRVWFRCPARNCGRRVALLYIGDSGIFACRHCYQLAYACQRETADDRATRRADRIRVRLGWEAGILNGEGGKPKGMRWCTFERLTARHDAFVGVSLAGMAQRFGLMDRRLDGVWDVLNDDG